MTLASVTWHFWSLNTRWWLTPFRRHFFLFSFFLKGQGSRSRKDSEREDTDFVQ
jgi:hypothetical protein